MTNTKHVRRRRIGKLFAGRRPRGRRARQLRKFGDYELWLRNSKREWVNFKLVLDPELRAPKANYWLSFNGERFVKEADAEALRNFSPMLGDAVLDYIVEQYPYLAEIPDFLL